MKNKVQTIRVALERDVARWTQLEAARRGISLSRFVDEILRECMPRKDHYEEAMGRALARKPFLTSDGKYLSREEVHDRSRFRRNASDDSI